MKALMLEVLCKSCNKKGIVDPDAAYCPFCANRYIECGVNVAKLAVVKRASDAYIGTRQMLTFLLFFVLFFILPSLTKWPWLLAFSGSLFGIFVFMIVFFILIPLVCGEMARKKFPEYHDQK